MADKMNRKRFRSREEYVEYRKAWRRLKGCSLEQLVEVRKVLNNWGWHWVLGEKPPNWERLPNYRKPRMPKETITKKDYIEPYMKTLDILGITHERVYGKLF